MSYPLRLPPELDAEARERCARLGISLNAFIAVALDAYLRGAAGSAGEPRPAKAKAKRVKRPARQPQPEPAGGFEGDGEDDERDWRVFYRPDGWPLFDPEWQGRWEAVGENDQGAAAALYDEYWRTHEWPGGGKPPSGADWIADRD